jgi:hypothetical protein
VISRCEGFDECFLLLSGYCDAGLLVGAAVTGAAGSSLDEPDVAHTETHRSGCHTVLHTRRTRAVHDMARQSLHITSPSHATS